MGELKMSNHYKQKQVLAKWRRRTLLLKVLRISAYVSPSTMFVLVLWQAWSTVRTGRELFSSSMSRFFSWVFGYSPSLDSFFVTTFNVFFIIVFALSVLLFVTLMRLPTKLVRREVNRRLSRAGMKYIEFVNKRPDPERENYYIYKIHSFGTGVEELLDNRDCLKYAMRINFLSEVKQDKGDYINIYGKPQKFKGN